METNMVEVCRSIRIGLKGKLDDVSGLSRRWVLKVEGIPGEDDVGSSATCGDGCRAVNGAEGECC